MKNDLILHLVYSAAVKKQEHRFKFRILTVYDHEELRTFMKKSYRVDIGDRSPKVDKKEYTRTNKKHQR